MDQETNDIQDIPSRKITDEDRFYLEQAYKAPVEGIVRIEEAAKVLIGAASGTSGLYLAAFKLVQGANTVSGLLWLAPFLLWSASLICLILVLMPQEYKPGQGDPASWKKTFQVIQRNKFNRLRLGAVLFIAGILSGALPFLF